MYCIKCGVKLAESERQCPLCQTRVFHPDLTPEEGELLFPKDREPVSKIGSRWAQALTTAAFLLPLIISLMCDLQFNDGVTWSGYVMGALMLIYVVAVLPTWFKKYHPIVFVPCSFGAVALYLLYIDLVTPGRWFLSFALPLVGGLGLLVTAVVTLTLLLKRGRYFIFGGASIAFGAFMPLMEFLMDLTFQSVDFIGWSFYPLVTFVILGGLLIFFGIFRPARESVERRFFI